MFPEDRGSGNLLLKITLVKPLALPPTLVQMNHQECRLVHLDVLYCLVKKKKRWWQQLLLPSQPLQGFAEIGPDTGEPTKHTNCCFNSLF